MSSVKPTEGGFRQWWLHWVYPKAGLTHLDRNELSLGRDPHCDVALSDTKISRRHATLHLAPGSAPQIRDLGSSNGTAVNGRRCESAWLEAGSVLRVGQSLAVVVHTEHTPEIQTDHSTDPQFHYLGSEKLKAILEKARRIAPLPGAVFIHAETGTGKEYLAHRIHAASSRSGKLVAINCASVRGDLAAAQLFGYLKGAFTNANHSAPGALREAHMGTVFLDEVAELPLDSQALLLRATQKQEVTPVGSAAAVRADFRLICASHSNLIELVSKGAFRADLYYRLTAHQLSLPPLRERKEDVVALLERESGVNAERLQLRLIEELLLHDWPGNIRELCNVAAALRAQTGEPETWVTPPFAPRCDLASKPQTGRPPTVPAEVGSHEPVPSPRHMSSLEWHELYTKHRANAAEVARATGIKVSTVKRYFVKFGLRES